MLQQFHREKLGMMLRHEAGARVVGQYDANNTYQYIINREQVQLEWLEAAVAELGGTFDSQPAPDCTVAGGGADAARSVFQQDSRDAEEFVERWEARVEAMPNARHRGMLRVILGEALEHKRFFDLALAGRTDLLGRRAEQLGPPVGEVLPTRWIE